MAVISRQSLSVADKAVQIRRSVFVDKGHNPNFDKIKSKSPNQSGYQVFLLHAPPGLKLSENVQCCYNLCIHNWAWMS